MTFKLESAITRKVMKLDDRRQHNGDPCFREKSCTDHEGNVFNTQREMCKAWGVSESLYRTRRKHGMTQKQALTAPRWYQQKGGQDGKNATR